MKNPTISWVSAIAGGSAELAVYFEKSRQDHDLAVGELEVESSRTVQLCTTDGGTPRCTAPLVIHRDYRRVEGYSASVDDSAVIESSRYDAELTFSGDGTVTTRVSKASEGTAVGVTAAGTRELGPLLGLPRSRRGR